MVARGWRSAKRHDGDGVRKVEAGMGKTHVGAAWQGPVLLLRAICFKNKPSNPRAKSFFADFFFPRFYFSLSQTALDQTLSDS